MASGVSNVEALIVKATDVLNKENDPNAMQRICQAVLDEESGVEVAVRLIAYKIQSPQEWEAMQGLLVLQSCANNCGQAFQAEIGKFRFLNEMIKIISPKFLGPQRSSQVKTKVTQLLYTWTIDIPREAKIAEAYAMLKKQDIIQNDPQYLGVRAPPVELKPKTPFKDEEKTRLLQKLLQSKSPLDISMANTLIKHMVKEDERRTEKTTRRSVEVDTALINASVLDDMISQYRQNSGSKADLDLMSELNSSCSSLQTSIFRLVSEIDDKDDEIGTLLKANDELSRVIGRYKLTIEEGKEGIISEPPKDSVNSSQEDTLLDFSPDVAPKTPSTSTACLEGLSLMGSIVEKSAESQHKLDDIFSLPDLNMTAFNDLHISSPTFQEISSMLVPEKPQEQTKETKEAKVTTPFEDLDLLGSTLLRQSLPANVPPTGIQFKPQEKLSMNQLIGQKQPDNPDANLLVPSSSRSSSDCSGIILSSSASSCVLGGTQKGTFSDSNSSLSSMDNHTQSTDVEIPSKPKPQLGPIKSMHDLQVTLEDIQPSQHSALKLIDSNDITLSVHFTDNHPREDVSVLVVSVTSCNKQAVSNYVLQAVVPKGCKTRLLAPSATEMAAHSPFLPPPAVTQVLLIANPNQLNVFLKIMLSYSIDDDPYTDLGEVEHLPL